MNVYKLVLNLMKMFNNIIVLKQIEVQVIEH